MLVAFVTGLIFCLAIFPLYIGWLKTKQIEQFIREEGPESHAAKARTPTMGGIGFIIALIVISACLVYNGQWVSVLKAHGTISLILALVTGLACAALGIADDYGKVTTRSNKGLSARFRLFSELGIGLLLAGAMLYFKIPFDQLILGFHPELSSETMSLGAILRVFDLPDPIAIAYVFLMVPFLVAATSNAINLHDGMDGLAAGTCAISFLTLGLMLFISEQMMLAALSFAVVGCLLGFLCFNRYPAKVFMGDTGSLFLGGLMAGIVSVSGLLPWFVPLALIYIIESISVMAQVAYFKLTKPYQPEKAMSPIALALYKLTHRLPGDGKRLLRMAPIHHHFEVIAAEKGKPEWTVSLWFWLVQLGIASAVCLGFSHLP